MKKSYSEIVFDAISQIAPKLPEDSKRLVSALRDLSGDHPKELNVVLRSVDDKFLDICCHSKDQSEADIARTVENASEYLRTEYMMDADWAKYISEQFVGAIWAYENDRPIKEALKRFEKEAVAAVDTELIEQPAGIMAAAGAGEAVTEPLGEVGVLESFEADSDWGAPDSAGVPMEPLGVSAGGTGIIRPEYSEQGTGGQNDAKKKRLALIAGVAAMVIVIALGSFLVMGKFLGNDGGSSDDEAAVETVETTEEGAESTEDEAPAEEAGGPAPEDRVFAHRGTGGSENSFASFDSAISQGAKYLEQDVVLLDDGEFYVSHDRALTLDGAINQGNPRLRDVFDKYGKSVIYVVELKTRTSSAAHSLVSLIDEYGYEGNVIVQCFEQELLGAIKSDQPGITTMCLCDYNGRDGQGLVSSGCTSDYIDMICVDSNGGLMTSDNLQLAHNSDKKFGAWCLDSEAQIRQAIDMGLDFYFTRSPEMAIELETEYR